MSVNYKVMRKLGFCREGITEFCKAFNLDIHGMYAGNEIKQAIEKTPDSMETCQLRASIAFRVEEIIDSKPELLALFREEIKELGESCRVWISGLEEI
jgi:hypothetical protein